MLEVLNGLKLLSIPELSLPTDAQIVEYYVDPLRNGVCVCIQSKSFPILLKSEDIPAFNAEWERAQNIKIIGENKNE